MTTTTADKSEVAAPPQQRPTANLPAIAPPRIPWHPAIEERFGDMGVTKATWFAMVEAVFPLAQSVNSVIMALSYCKARKLDPFKRNVHIVPIWNSQLSRMVDTVWPGIGELRTTAFRTGQYAGRDETIFGPDITQKVGTVEITFPEWAQVTVYRMLQGQRVPFAGPKVYWLETYASQKRNDATPNAMWAKRTRGQLDKCAEASALRAAFPEEVGNEYIAEEAFSEQSQKTVQTTAGLIEDDRSESDQIADALEQRLNGGNASAPDTESELPDDPAMSGEDSGESPAYIEIFDELAMPDPTREFLELQRQHVIERQGEMSGAECGKLMELIDTAVGQLPAEKTEKGKPKK